MFHDPILRKLKLLYRYASDPQNSVWGNDTSSYWYRRFHRLISSDIAHGDSKKAIEANRLILFALRSPLFPDGTIIARENPDFIINTPSRNIGVEVRDVYVHLPHRLALKGQEVLKDNIVQLAHKIFQNTGQPPVTVSFVFHRSTAFRKSATRMIAEKLAKCVPPSLASSNELLSIHEDNIGAGWLPELIAVIGCKPFPYEPASGRWTASHGGSVFPCEEFFQAAIDDKEGRIAEYRKSLCDEIWLLLVVSGFDASGLMCKPKCDAKFRSSFDRVFVLWLPELEVGELVCTQVKPESDGCQK